MKRILSCTALFAALTLPSLAGTEMAPAPDSKDMKMTAEVRPSDAGIYVAVYGGANFDTFYGNNRQTVDTPTTVASSNNDMNAGWGGVGGIKVGYAFDSIDAGMGSLRLQPAVEAEALYIGTDRTHVTDAFVTPSDTRFSSNSGDFFINGILRFKNSSIVTPYIGLGVGLQYITTHGEYTDAIALPNALGLPPGTHVHATGLDTSDLDFAGQGLFGLDIQICPHLSLFSEYKFIDAIGTDGKSNFLNGDTYRFKPDQIQQNLITVGVKYSF